MGGLTAVEQWECMYTTEAKEVRGEIARQGKIFEWGRNMDGLKSGE